MTALPFKLRQMLACGPGRSKPGFARGCGLASMALLALLALAPVGAARADDPIKGEVKAVVDNGYARLMFQFDEPVEAKARVSGAIIVVTFNKPVSVAVERLNVNAPEFISAARRDPDGSAIRLALTHKVKVNTIGAAERLYVDLLPENWEGPMPGLPQEVIDGLVRRAREAERQLHKQQAEEKNKKPPLVRVKVANQPTFVRYVFAMPGTVNVVPERADGRLTLNFDQQVNWDMADAKASLPPTLKSIESEVELDFVAVVFALNGTPEVRVFREDRNIVVDIGLDGAKPKQAEAAGAPKQSAALEWLASDIAAANDAVEGGGNAGTEIRRAGESQRAGSCRGARSRASSSASAGTRGAKRRRAFAGHAFRCAAATAGCGSRSCGSRSAAASGASRRKSRRCGNSAAACCGAAGDHAAARGAGACRRRAAERICGAATGACHH